MKFLLSMATAATVAAFSTMPATAQTATADIGVTLDVQASCTATATPLTFPAATGNIAAPINGTATVDVTCTNGATYELGLNGGGENSTAARKMTSTTVPANKVDYQLYQEAGHTNVWGNVQGATVEGTGSGTAFTHTVYGQVSPQNAPVGSYSDTVTATIWYGSSTAPAGGGN
ncbi:hypothetical protein GCM10011491_12730 [Brucella endophytica]|uniref:Spore coat protein U/FanG domain-containing protein n=1 Tax=Brucella endophytica TaxID=1963359 RepID=A0A916S7C8_9HYPH|nr:spore coat U domain-containing protein [Brucella endophytica]GGA86536.1 hypothetical protein GCM10011491_12730 [Brucella endophytica]